MLVVSMMVFGVCVIDGVGIYCGVCVYASDENVSKYEERLEKEFEECCILNVLGKSSHDDGNRLEYCHKHSCCLFNMLKSRYVYVTAL